ncbi:MAG: RNA polymerase sigma factor [Fimbriimonas sp.]|nr:RNA polymerase sigma factor [Fimbriimonas sp.]
MIDTARAEKAVAGRMSFEEARDVYESLVFAYVSRRIRPIEEAEDIVAHIFVDAYMQWRRLRGEPKHWLLGIARRKVCDALRKRRRSVPLRDGDAVRCALGGFIQAIEARQAVEIVMQLPDDQRDAFLLQILEQFSIEEIAVVMGRSTASVNSLLQRARARIQRTLDGQRREGVIE